MKITITTQTNQKQHNMSMEVLEIHEYKAKTIENAIRLVINCYGAKKRKHSGEDTALDRELLKAEKYIQEVLTTAGKDDNQSIAIKPQYVGRGDRRIDNQEKTDQEKTI
jgi:hypothetical protein